MKNNGFLPDEDYLGGGSKYKWPFLKFPTLLCYCCSKAEKWVGTKTKNWLKIFQDRYNLSLKKWIVIIFNTKIFRIISLR